MAVDLNPKLDHAGRGAPVDDDVVHRQRVEHALAVAHDLGMHQAAMVLLVFAAQDRLQRHAVLVQRNVGDEAKPSLVDADQGHAVARELPADAQHGAVAAHHQHQVAPDTDGRNVQGRVPCDAGTGCRLAFEYDLAALRAQEVRNIVQSGTGGSGRRSRDRGMVLADQGYMAELGFHWQITSLKFAESLAGPDHAR